MIISLYTIRLYPIKLTEIIYPAVVGHYSCQTISLFSFYKLAIMYPGVACNKIIPVVKTKDLCFKENDDKSVLPAITSPSVNIGESTDAYLISIASPGLHREDFQIEIENSIVSISAKRESVVSIYKSDRCEYDFSKWTRAFRLPKDADTIMTNAEYIQGELIIHIPRNDSNENKANAIIYVY